MWPVIASALRSCAPVRPARRCSGESGWGIAWNALSGASSERGKATTDWYLSPLLPDLGRPDFAVYGLFVDYLVLLSVIVRLYYIQRN